jgi:hypothetical protein
MHPVDLRGQRLGALGGIVVLLMLLGSALVHANNAKELEILEIKPSPTRSKVIRPGWPLVSLRKPAVVVSVDREDTTYVIGETITFLIKVSQRAAQVSLRDAEREFRFPSPPHRPLLVKEGTTMAIACQSTGYPGTKRVIITATAVGGHSDQAQMSTQEVTLLWPDIRLKHVPTTSWHCQVL